MSDVLYPRRWLVLALLGASQFMLILDVTVVAIALPHLGADLGLGRETLTWVVSAYTLTFGGLMLLGGRLADIFGPRRLVLAGLLVFTIASLAAGLSDSGTALLAGRVGQGLGAAMLSPAALSVVVRLFEGDERNRALGIWSSLGGAGAATGVLVGGVLVAGPGWAWVFLVNVPVGLLVWIVLLRVLPPLPSYETGLRRRADLLGAGLVTAATGTAIYALIGAGQRGWADPATLGLFALAALLYLLFGVRQRRAAVPLMDLTLLSRRPVAAGTFVIAVATALMVSVFFLGSFFFQDRAGHGALAAGLLFLPVALATMAGAQLGGRIIGSTGARPLAVGGFVVAAGGMTLAAVTTTTLGVAIGISLGSAGIGALFVVASVVALSRVEHHEAGVASGILSTFHELGASVGVAVVSSVAAGSLAAQSSEGYTQAFLTGGAVALAGALLAAALIPSDREARTTTGPGRSVAA